MTAQVGRICGYRDVVTDAGGDLVMAAWADVGLRGLVRLHATHLHSSEAPIPQAHGYPRSAHTNRPITASVAAATNT